MNLSTARVRKFASAIPLRAFDALFECSPFDARFRCPLLLAVSKAYCQRCQ
jgi:hypothetical protein